MNHLNLIIAALLVSLSLSLGCSAPQTALQADLDRVQQDLDDLTESHKALNHRYESLQDRLALLEDRSEAVALQRNSQPVLPVVRVRPSEKPESVGSELPPATITQSDLDRLAVKTPAARPRSRPTIAPPPNAYRAGNVGVKDVSRRIPMGGPNAASDDPLQAYKSARALFDSGNLGKANVALTEFVDRWPKHTYADNALLLLGKSRFNRAEYRAAVSIFRRVVGEYPTGNQVPDALLMTGLTLERLGQVQQAQATLSRLKAMYPGTEAAKRAAQALTTFRGRR